ncbi:MAG: hypothetical protein ACT4PJ_07195 [Gemmatimonadaceae bacterium]
MKHRVPVAAALVVAGAFACTEVGTDPAVPIAIEIDAPLMPAIALDDTLRDTLGLVAPIVARALNSRNEVIRDAPITFVALRNDSSIIEVDAETGTVVGTRLGDADVVAQVAGLQSVRLPIRVTRPPDTVIAVSPLVDSVLYAIGDDTARALTVEVVQRANVDGRDTLLAVQFWRARYTITSPADLEANTDTTRVYMANGVNRLSRVDTTDASGQASRRIRFPLLVVSDIARRTFVTEVVVLRADGTPLPGSPVLFTTVIRPR